MASSNVSTGLYGTRRCQNKSLTEVCAPSNLRCVLQQSCGSQQRSYTASAIPITRVSVRPFPYYDLCKPKDNQNRQYDCCI